MDQSQNLPLFVYGSLVDPAHRAEVLGRHADGTPAILLGYERGRSRHWYVRRRAGARTEGFVLHALGESDFGVLDRYEEVPALYTREQIEVAAADGAALRCWIYLPTAWADAEP